MNQIKVELQSWMGSDRDVANAAWTSSATLASKELKTQADVNRVVKMLIKDKHASPIESVVFRFWIKMPISTDRQHMTHRIASHNGMSGRYRTMPNEWQKTPQDVKDILDKLGADGNRYAERYELLCAETNSFYRDLLTHTKDAEKNEGISNKDYKRIREFFRGVLPQNNMTERTTIMNLRSFANYMKLRNSEHAQPEIRYVAQLMLDQVKKSNICPVAIEALEENGWNI